MTTATRSNEYTGKTSQVLYVSFELGVEEWKLGFTKDLGDKPRVRVMPARDLKQLAREIAAAKPWFGLSATAAVRSCYEAGRDGFWLHRHLTSTGVDNRVVDSSSIEVNRRQRRAKSDRLDVRKLLGMLLRYHAGESKVWSVVRVPTVDEEDRRQLHRELRTLKKERTRVTNRMQGLLATQGIRLPKGRDLGALLEGLAAVPESEGSGGGRRPRPHALPERGQEPRTGDQQSGKPAHPSGCHRNGVVLAAIPACEPIEPMVPGALLTRRDARAESRHRSAGTEAVD